MTNLDITSCYVGDSQVDKIYLGTDIVWQKQSPAQTSRTQPSLSR